MADVAESARVLTELSIEAAGVGTFDWNLLTGRLVWNDRLIEQFGYDRAAFTQSIEAFHARVHPEDLAKVGVALDASIDSCGPFDSEYRIVRPDGETRWISAKGRALRGESGVAERLLGATLDVTATRASESAVATIVETMSTAFLSMDHDWRLRYVNTEAERLLGRARLDLIGHRIWTLFPGTVGTEFERNYRRAVDTGQLVIFDAYYPEPLDAWYEVRATPTSDGLSLYFLDITVRRRAQEEAENAARRAALVARVTSGLAETLEAEEAGGRLAALVVPDLADWALVTLVEDAPGARHPVLRDVAWRHRDPALQQLVARYSRTRIGALVDQGFLVRLLADGEPHWVPTGAAEEGSALLRPGEAQDLFRRLAPASAAVIPLRARGRTVGKLSLYRAPDRSPASPEDQATMREVAGRAAMALDNSRLYRQQLHLAEGLQRALLTAPPQPDHVQVAVRYSPAAEAAHVGGDWYDAFLQPGGATVLVIGDVVGHDAEAAAGMGQVRTLLRGIGAVGGDGPAEILRKVDRLLQTLQVETTATAVVARLEQSPEDLARGVTHLRWSNAGHLPPMVVGPDGDARPLDGPAPDLLLGVDPDTDRDESVVTLQRGSVVLLYTDGLIERRGESLDEGLALLQRTMSHLVDHPLGELCDEVLRLLLPEQPEDDVALVAVRLHDQEGPRPAEAGANDVPDNVPEDPAEP